MPTGSVVVRTRIRDGFGTYRMAACRGPRSNRRMTTHLKTEPGAQVGDCIEAHNIAGGGRRLGEIIEVLGGPAHEHYRVRWEDDHESLCYPADGVVVPRRDAGDA